MIGLIAALVAAAVPYEAWFLGTSSIDEPEVIPPAYRGLWAPCISACKDQYDVEVMSVKPGGADFYEGQERTIKLKLSYEGEGGFWDRTETWALNADGSKMSITRGDDLPFSLVKCGL